ncbi:MAG TPA: sigma 54-interacting transcriptional regulator [Burkholderiales bacterium]|nr:sigma 54-interacting transcriptional regulator [Burkholderiales bacterium]
MVYISCVPPPGLSREDRAFFGTLADIVYGNAFAANRIQSVAELVPGATLESLRRDEQALARVVAPRLERYLRAGGIQAPGLSDADRWLIARAALYVCYIRGLRQFDAHIERQAAKAGEPLPVSFADSVVGDLVRCGYDEESALRYFALFFQLRRGFNFIRSGLTGASPSMYRLREALWNNIFTHDVRGFEAALWSRMEDFSTLVLGETGTGKGAVAAAIGRSSFIPYDRARQRFAANFTQTFIAINLSQFPETIIESELFGHRKGAFTGAIDHHEGIFARCNEHGALFLDEIGEVSIPVQIKLLQVLQERTFTPVGGREQRRFGGRVIAATNQPLASLRGDGRFRNDFFYRLCSDVIEVPTLRQRIAESPAELELLVRLLVTRIAGSELPELVSLVMDALEANLPRDYAWPGNVRELEQAVRRILVTGRYTGEPVRPPVGEGAALAAKLAAGELTADELLGRYGALLHRRCGSYAEVARRLGVDVRTARKYVASAKAA